MKITDEHIKRVVKDGSWIIRADNDGESYGGFRWNPLGEWTEAPDWNPEPCCGGGLHGQDCEHGGMLTGNRLLFCETEGEHIPVGENKVKVRKARILMVDSLPEGLEVDGRLNLSCGPSLTSLPEGLKVGGDLDLSCCPSLTSLPEELKVGGDLDLERCTSLTSLHEGLKVGGGLYLRGCSSLTSIPEGLKVGGEIYGLQITFRHVTKGDHA